LKLASGELRIVRGECLATIGAVSNPDQSNINLGKAGGVTVSYFEWVQNRGGYYWDEPTVNERLRNIMVHSFRDVLKLSQQHKVNMRTAAYMVAISRVATVHRLRGIYA
jgi:glutamate dehydrogenase (NAD(P)+)